MSIQSVSTAYAQYVQGILQKETPATSSLPGYLQALIQQSSGIGSQFSDTSGSSQTAQILAALEKTSDSQYVANLNALLGLGNSENNRQSFYLENQTPNIETGTNLAFAYSNLLGTYTSVNSYVDAFDPTVTAYLQTMRQNGELNPQMSFDQQVAALYNNVISNFDYINKTGDHWNFSGETIGQGGGDCNDLSLLLMNMVLSLGYENGLNPSTLENSIKAVVGTSQQFGDHCYLEYTAQDGKTYVLDPSLALQGHINNVQQLQPAEIWRQTFKVDFEFNAQSTQIFPSPNSIGDSNRYVDINSEEMDKLFQSLKTAHVILDNASTDTNLLRLLTVFQNNFKLLNTQGIQWNVLQDQAGNQRDLGILFANMMYKTLEQQGVNPAEMNSRLSLIFSTQEDEQAIFIKYTDEQGISHLIDPSEKYFTTLPKTDPEIFDLASPLEILTDQIKTVSWQQFPKFEDLLEHNLLPVDYSLGITDPLLQNRNKIKTFNTHFGLPGFVAQQDTTPEAWTLLATRWDPKFNPKDKTGALPPFIVQGAPILPIDGVLLAINMPNFENVDVAALTQSIDTAKSQLTSSGNDSYSIMDVFRKTAQYEIARLSDWNSYIKVSGPTPLGTSGKVSNYAYFDDVQFEVSRANLQKTMTAYQFVAQIVQSQNDAYGIVTEEMLGVQAYQKMDVMSSLSQETNYLNRAASTIRSDIEKIVNSRNQLLRSSLKKYVAARQNYLNQMGITKVISKLAQITVSMFTIGYVVPLVYQSAVQALLAAVLTAPLAPIAALGFATAHMMKGGLAGSMFEQLNKGTLDLAPDKYKQDIKNAFNDGLSSFGAGIPIMAAMLLAGSYSTNMGGKSVAKWIAASIATFDLITDAIKLDSMEQNLGIEQMFTIAGADNRKRIFGQGGTVQTANNLFLNSYTNSDTPSVLSRNMYGDIETTRNEGLILPSLNGFSSVNSAAYLEHYSRIKGYEAIYGAFQKIRADLVNSRSLIHQEMSGQSGFQSNQNIQAILQSEFSYTDEMLQKLFNASQEVVEQFNNAQSAYFQFKAQRNDFQGQLKGYSIGIATMGIPFIGGTALQMGIQRTTTQLQNYSVQDYNLPIIAEIYFTAAASNLSKNQRYGNIVDVGNFDPLGSLVTQNFIGYESDSLGSNLSPAAVNALSANGYAVIDAYAINLWRDQLQRKTACLKMIAQVRSYQVDARNVVHQEMTNVSGRKYGQGLLQLFDAENTFAEQALQAKISLAQTYVQTQNQLRAKTTAMKQAMNGAIPFAGKTLMKQFNKTNPGSDLNIKFQQYVLNPDLFLGLPDTTTDVANFLIYSRGSKVNNGTNNYVVVDTDTINLYLDDARAKNLADSAIFAVRSAIKEARRLVHQEMTNISGANEEEYTKSIIDVHNDNRLKKLQQKQRMAGELAQLYTKYAQAQFNQKKLQLESIIEIIGGIFAVVEAILLPGFPELAFAVAGFLNTLVEFVFMDIQYRANDDFDKKALVVRLLYQLLKTASKQGGKGAMKALDDQQAQAEMSANLMQTSSGNGTVSSNSALVSTAQAKFDRAQKLKEAFIKINSASKNSRNRVLGTLGRAGGRSDGGYSQDVLSTSGSAASQGFELNRERLQSAASNKEQKLSGRSINLVKSGISVVQSAIAAIQAVSGALEGESKDSKSGGDNKGGTSTPKESGGKETPKTTANPEAAAGDKKETSSAEGKKPEAVGEKKDTSELSDSEKTGNETGDAIKKFSKGIVSSLEELTKEGSATAKVLSTLGVLAKIYAQQAGGIGAGSVLGEAAKEGFGKKGSVEATRKERLENKAANDKARGEQVKASDKPNTEGETAATPNEKDAENKAKDDKAKAQGKAESPSQNPPKKDKDPVTTSDRAVKFLKDQFLTLSGISETLKAVDQVLNTIGREKDNQKYKKGKKQREEEETTLALILGGGLSATSQISTAGQVVSDLQRVQQQGNNNFEALLGGVKANLTPSINDKRREDGNGGVRIVQEEDLGKFSIFGIVDKVSQKLQTTALDKIDDIADKAQGIPKAQAKYEKALQDFVGPDLFKKIEQNPEARAAYEKVLEAFRTHADSPSDETREKLREATRDFLLKAAIASAPAEMEKAGDPKATTEQKNQAQQLINKIQEMYRTDPQFQKAYSAMREKMVNGTLDSTHKPGEGANKGHVYLDKLFQGIPSTASNVTGSAPVKETQGTEKSQETKLPPELEAATNRGFFTHSEMRARSNELYNRASTDISILSNKFNSEAENLLKSNNVESNDFNKTQISNALRDGKNSAKVLDKNGNVQTISLSDEKSAPCRNSFNVLNQEQKQLQKDCLQFAIDYGTFKAQDPKRNENFASTRETQNANRNQGWGPSTTAKMEVIFATAAGVSPSRANYEAVTNSFENKLKQISIYKSDASLDKYIKENNIPEGQANLMRATRSTQLTQLNSTFKADAQQYALVQLATGRNRIGQITEEWHGTDTDNGPSSLNNAFSREIEFTKLLSGLNQTPTLDTTNLANKIANMKSADPIERANEFLTIVKDNPNTPKEVKAQIQLLQNLNATTDKPRVSEKTINDFFAAADRNISDPAKKAKLAELKDLALAVFSDKPLSEAQKAQFENLKGADLLGAKTESSKDLRALITLNLSAFITADSQGTLEIPPPHIENISRSDSKTHYDTNGLKVTTITTEKGSTLGIAGTTRRVVLSGIQDQKTLTTLEDRFFHSNSVIVDKDNGTISIKGNISNSDKAFLEATFANSPDGKAALVSLLTESENTTFSENETISLKTFNVRGFSFKGFSTDKAHNRDASLYQAEVDSFKNFDTSSINPRFDMAEVAGAQIREMSQSLQIELAGDMGKEQLLNARAKNENTNISISEYKNNPSFTAQDAKNDMRNITALINDVSKKGHPGVTQEMPQATVAKAVSDSLLKTTQEYNTPSTNPNESKPDSRALAISTYTVAANNQLDETFNKGTPADQKINFNLKASFDDMNRELAAQRRGLSPTNYQDVKTMGDLKARFDQQESARADNLALRSIVAQQTEIKFSDQTQAVDQKGLLQSNIGSIIAAKDGSHEVNAVTQKYAQTIGDGRGEAAAVFENITWTEKGETIKTAGIKFEGGQSTIYNRNTGASNISQEQVNTFLSIKEPLMARSGSEIILNGYIGADRNVVNGNITIPITDANILAGERAMVQLSLILAPKGTSVGKSAYLQQLNATSLQNDSFTSTDNLEAQIKFMQKNPENTITFIVNGKETSNPKEIARAIANGQDIKVIASDKSNPSQKMEIILRTHSPTENLKELGDRVTEKDQSISRESLDTGIKHFFAEYDFSQGVPNNIYLTEDGNWSIQKPPQGKFTTITQQDFANLRRASDLTIGGNAVAFDPNAIANINIPGIKTSSVANN